MIIAFCSHRIIKSFIYNLLYATAEILSGNPSLAIAIYKHVFFLIPIHVVLCFQGVFQHLYKVLHGVGSKQLKG